ncbi:MULTISPECIES: two-component system histidine kinase PnpS [Staphylococcus]|uniref:Sensor protein kinase WalK n=1 Tax=Staphylococcus saprophyticus subsp. saprophyticus (strain ATCC 15305 / DSM 20229 / NCIMB 8711 / NCTC 7292 / S-41) TaxID=342451 RepID=Q49YC2_STAS1|nr:MULTISPECIES: HAMP domain-containing sensor histidine kinase [Staphylococcus]ASE59171.1 sensor histidine kinase [Staphylococcus saprophyticus]ASF17941.1 sensor histidine kinase [Staphylococcus saprophyticus]MBN6755345.1 PAS domain-containing protein [Staphylococcus saprophyticus]MBN6765323.1 PAS domain-containing protein [Staphylococcus saprophyticus]MBN6770129.1 PAS domain-containing protein [Staphylococcus saprophyticus]
MLKFQQRLLFLLCIIVIISFLALGAIITHAIYNTVSSAQEGDLEHQADHLVKLYKNDKENEMTDIAKSEKLTVKIEESNDVLFSTNQGTQINEDIKNEANPSRLIYDKENDDRRYTFKTTIDDKDVYLSGINNEILELQIQMWKYIALIGLFVIIIIFLVVRSINRTYIRPINEVTYATNLLAEGYYHVRVPESNVKETRELFVTTNELARRLQRLNHKQKLQSNRLKTTVENIPSSILMIDKYGEIVVANKSFYNVFTPEKAVEHKSYVDFVDLTLQKLITEAFKVEKPIYDQIELTIDQVHQKYFDTSCVPILSKTKKNLYGMVIVLHDITNLKKLENLRREFVANVSHELKTPITSIKGFAETLLDGAKNDEQTLNEFLKIISKESDRIETLVFDLLDLSHVEQQTEIVTEYVSLSEIAESTIKNMQNIAEEKQITIVNEIKPDIVIDANKDKVSQVALNLLSNAVSYSKASSEVIVRVYKDANKRIMEVQDFGIGISAEDQQHIFERFYRVDKARSRDSGGTGLGLSITKHIMEAHNGRINVFSRPNEGSTFRVTFFE